MKRTEIIRDLYEDTASFRIAPGGRTPWSGKVRRLIVKTKDPDTYAVLKDNEDQLKKIFNVEAVVFE